MTGKNRKRLILLVKVLIVLGLGFVIYFHIYKQDNWEEITSVFVTQLSADRWPLLVIVVLLMPLNWLLETVKWRKLVTSFEQISFKTAFQSILLGIVMAMITPARIGEYAGRLSLLREKSQSVGATLLGSIAQNLITLIVGLSAIFLFIDHFLALNIEVKNLYYVIVGLVIIGLSWLYYNMSFLIKLLSKISFLRPVTNKIPDLNHYKKSLLNLVLVYSFARYLVYLSQYFLLLLFFGIDSDPIILLAGIAILFLMQSGVPLPPMLSIIARGELAVLIWSNVSDNTIAALAVSFSLWIINLIVPALFGLGILFNVKWKNTDR